MEVALEMRSNSERSFCDARNSLFAAMKALRRWGLGVAIMRYGEKQRELRPGFITSNSPQNTQP